MTKTGWAGLIAVAVLLGACSDGPVAPKSEASQVPEVTGGGATESLTGWDTLRFVIPVDPNRNNQFWLGAGNTVNIPAHSLCNPVTSTYGATEWDKPCQMATSITSVWVKAWLDNTGHAHVDFTTPLRFVPTSDPAGWVMLTFTDHAASQNGAYNILYCKTPTSGCYNEAILDPTLATHRDPATGRVSRRVKHFSGYNVAAGTACDPTPDDPDCIDTSSMTNVINVKGLKLPSQTGTHPVLRDRPDPR